MSEKERFIEAYNHFRESVDLEAEGILPESSRLVWYLLMGIPEVPADEDPAPDAPLKAIEQRTAILKAVFVEVNRDQPDGFLDEGLARYDRAAKTAKMLFEEGSVSGRTASIPSGDPDVELEGG